MPKHPGSLQLQPRDIELLTGLFESRLMTIAHAAEIHFGGKRESAKKRIQRLKAAGFLKERPRKPYEPSILHLAQKGVTSLLERGILADYPPLSLSAIRRRNQVSQLTLHHELQVMDIKAALYREARTNIKIKIISLCTWPLLNEFTGRGSAWAQSPWTVRPDGLLRFNRFGNFHKTFLEIDRSTESQGKLHLKAQRYATLLRELRNPNRVIKTKSREIANSTKVFFVFPTKARMLSFERSLVDPPFESYNGIHFGTLDEILLNPKPLIG